MSARNFLDDLNREQRAAVEWLDGPVMIIAGAGSGKTRVLTYRIAHLLGKGVDPFRVLALTFTNKAAREMRERIATLIGNEARNLWMGTFHSTFARLLRRESHRLGFPPHFTIFDTEDSKSLLKSIVKEMDLNDTAYKPSSLLGRISALKNNLISAADYARDVRYVSEDKAARREHFARIYETYTKRLFKSAAMDFDDLLFFTNVLLRDHPDILLKYQDMFRYILVDEYQDTNFSQFMILRQLAARHQNICVVGDDAQSIYAFRGANIQNILNFQKQYSDTAVFKLEQNYRSTKTIVNAANQVIAKNRDQLAKNVWTDNDEGEKIPVLRAFTDSEEGRIIAQNIYELNISVHARYSEFAILYRTNAQSRSLEEALRKLGIPYRIYGGLSFYQRKEVKDMLAYFRLAINPQDEEALRRIINYPRREIGDTSVEKMTVAAYNNDISLWTVMENLADFDLGFQNRTREKIMQFVTLIKSFSAIVPSRNAFQAGDYIASASGIMKELLQDRTPEGINRMDNVQELLNGLRDFSLNAEKNNTPASLNVFMEDIALLTGEDKNEENERNTDKVLLMTIHSAKGLEFNYVFVSGLEENLFPSQMSLMAREELEEERRLFYVALTRAKKKATLTYCMSRYRYGSSISCEPSRFLGEIPPQFLENVTPLAEEPFLPREISRMPRHDNAGHTNGAPPALRSPLRKKTLVSLSRGQLKPLPADNRHLEGLMQGMVVEHDRFGRGEVLKTEGIFPNSKAIVLFENGEKKQLLLRFAKLKIVQ